MTSGYRGNLRVKSSLVSSLISHCDKNLRDDAGVVPLFLVLAASRLLTMLTGVRRENLYGSARYRGIHPGSTVSQSLRSRPLGDACRAVGRVRNGRGTAYLVN